MCLEFGSCFGGRRRDDYGGRGRSRGNHGNGYWSEPAPVSRQPPTVAVHEAHHDGPPKADHADAGGHADLQDKAGSETPQKLPAWHNKVGDDAGYGAYTPRVHEADRDGPPKADHADAGGHGGYADLQDKVGSETPQKLPAWHNKVGDDAGYGAYTPRVHEAHHDGAPKADHADAGGHGGYADLQDKAGSETPQKLPSWHNQVGEDAGYGAYTPRVHETAADHREHAAMDYHQYPTTTTTTLARYEVASR